MTWDPFATLGLPRRFALSAAEVERAYLQRAAGLHPDIAGDETDTTSADLNRARQDLKNPESRANILLALLGGPGKEHDRSLPDGFLMEMMEVRQQMEEEGAAGREKWEKWGEARRAGHEGEVGRLFKEVEEGESRGEREAKVLKAIRMQLNAWRYIERMLEQVGDDAE